MTAARWEASWIGRLRGARVLVAEDEFITALELQTLLEDSGAEVIGPCCSVEWALREASLRTPDAAVLDIRLGRSVIHPVARMLSDRGVPFVFYTGQTGEDPAVAAWPAAPRLSKPCPGWMLLDTVAALLPAA